MQSTAYRRGGRSVRERGRRGGNAGVQVLANGVHVEAKRRVQLDPSTAPHQHGPVGCHAPALRLAPGRPPSTLPLALAPCRTCTKRPSSRMQSRDEAGRGRGNKGRVAGGRRVAAGASQQARRVLTRHPQGNTTGAAGAKQAHRGNRERERAGATADARRRTKRAGQAAASRDPRPPRLRTTRQGKVRQGKARQRRAAAFSAHRSAR
jgi:hypothetical protein